MKSTGEMILLTNARHQAVLLAAAMSNEFATV
jgi:hypothetical protein